MGYVSFLEGTPDALKKDRFLNCHVLMLVFMTVMSLQLVRCCFVFFFKSHAFFMYEFILLTSCLCCFLCFFIPSFFLSFFFDLSDCHFSMAPGLSLTCVVARGGETPRPAVGRNRGTSLTPLGQEGGKST